MSLKKKQILCEGNKERHKVEMTLPRITFTNRVNFKLLEKYVKTKKDLDSNVYVFSITAQCLFGLSLRFYDFMKVFLYPQTNLLIKTMNKPTINHCIP